MNAGQQRNIKESYLEICNRRRSGRPPPVLSAEATAQEKVVVGTVKTPVIGSKRVEPGKFTRFLREGIFFTDHQLRDADQTL